MPDDVLIARNPAEGSSLPCLLRVPLGPDGVVHDDRAPLPAPVLAASERGPG